MTKLCVTDLSISAKANSLVERASFDLRAGELVIILGPNGAGKTSLLRGVLGLAPITSGQVLLEQQVVHDMASDERARAISYLPQARPLAWPNRVHDVVALGRFAHGGVLGRLGPVDRKAVDRAIEACDLAHLRNRQTDTLSGGELARVHCARAFAGEAPWLIADEPVAALDPHHKFRIMGLIRQFVDGGGGALIVLHDISLAAQYADRLIWMQGGKIIADGSVTETLTVDRLRQVYGVQARINGSEVLLAGIG